MQPPAASTRSAGHLGRWSLTGAALAIYGLARLIGLDFLLLAERQLRGTPVSGPRFRLWHDALFRWDVGFYHGIAADGYQAALPIDAAGVVLGNKWAFFPVFPLAARLTARATGLDFEYAAILLNLFAGAVAALCLAALVRRLAGEGAALRAVAFWSFFPTAFVLQIPYAEAIWSMCACGFLLALIDRRHGVAALLLVAAGLTRGSTIPLSAAALCHVWLHRTSRHRNAERPGPADASHRTPVFALATLTAAAVVAPLLWIGIAALVTGRPDAYAATQRAWGYAPDLSLTFSRWIDLIGRLAGEPFSLIVALTLVVVVVLSVATFRLPLPTELKVYAGCAAVFLFLVAQPGAVAFTSTPRFVFGILTIPIVLALLVRRPANAAVVLGIFVVLQYLWVVYVWSGRLGIAP